MIHQHALKSLRELADEAADELPAAIPDDGGPPKHPAAEGSDNPLLEDDYERPADDPVDTPEVDDAVDKLANAVAMSMEDHGYPEWRRTTAYRMLVDEVRDVIVKHATPKANR